MEDINSPEADFGFTGKMDRRAMHVALLALALIVLLRTAWMSDDAEITLRCVMNLLHGYGPTFNADERVQAFTHPLWFMLISAASAILGNIFAATFTLSIVLSIVTWWLLLSRIATNFWSGMLAGSALLLSKAYIDFSTSGLENPLSHFLLIYGLLSGFRYLESGDKRLLSRSLNVLGLIYLCRPDLMLLVAPFCLQLLWNSYEDRRTSVRLVVVAAMPALLWTIFQAFSTMEQRFPILRTRSLRLEYPQANTSSKGLFICSTRYREIPSLWLSPQLGRCWHLLKAGSRRLSAWESSCTCCMWSASGETS